MLGQLTHDELRVFDLASFERIASHPLSGPRALVALADGALLAVGGDRALRFEPGNRRFEPVVRPALLWGDIYADAQLRDRIWLFDGGGAPALGPPQLHAFRLVAGAARVQLPEQSIELAAPRGGVFGASREGVWLYLTPGRAERLSPGGLRLPGFALAETELPAWVLPARRLDQGLWLDEAGSLSRRLVVPPGRRLGAPAELAGRPYAVAVGDEGKLVAVTAVTAPGPGFELLLLDAELRLVARRELPSEEPPDGDDWVQAVTANQQVAVSSTKPLVAVGGPGRLRVLDGRGEEIFSIPSR